MRSPNLDVEIKEKSEAEETEGSLKSQAQEDKLMRSVLDNDKETIDDGKLISDAINQGISSFTPDLAFEQMTKNFTVAKQIFGEKLIKMLSGYDADYIKKNIKIPEFQKELYGAIKKKIERLKKKKLLDKQGFLTDTGVDLASIILYTEELDNIVPKGMLGERVHKKLSHYGETGDSRIFHKGDRYKDLDIRKTIKTATRRGHSKISNDDLKTFERRKKGSIDIIYAIDASGSMKGEKIEMSKKAGIALAYKAINHNDKVGLIVFGNEVKESIAPTLNFMKLMKEITRIQASKETDFVIMIEKAIELFPNRHSTKHLVLLTDAMPTVGDNPEKDTLKLAGEARSKGITLSLVGINLDRKNVKFAEEMVRVGGGRLYLVKNIKNLDKIILEDYYSVM